MPLQPAEPRQLKAVSPDDCARACTQESGFRCVSFDYHKGRNECDLSDKRAQDVGGLKANYPKNPYDHYSR